MFTIALVGQKGGTGKSTICHALANAILARSGTNKTLLVDTDPQGSTLRYMQKATERYASLHEQLSCVLISNSDQLVEVVEQANELEYDFAIFDTQGHHNKLALDIMSVSDRVLIPVRAVHDEYESQLLTLYSYLQLKRKFELDGEALAPGGLLLNDIRPGNRLNREQTEALNTISNNPMLLGFYLPKRNGYETMGNGKVLTYERQALNGPTDTLKRNAIDADIAAAEAVLRAIEAMEQMPFNDETTALFNMLAENISKTEMSNANG